MTILLLCDLRTKKYYISLRDKNKVFDIKTTRGTSGDGVGNVMVYGIASQHEISWITKEGKPFHVTVSFYDNPHIENGISISLDQVSKKALGLCVKNYRPKLMTIPNVMIRSMKSLLDVLQNQTIHFNKRL